MTPARSLSSNDRRPCRLLRRRLSHNGFSLIEIMMVLAIMGIISAFMFPALQQFQEQGVKEINQNDLFDRAQRLSIHMTRELGMAGFMLGRRPEPAITINGTTYGATILVTNSDTADDQITILKAESFFPKMITAAAIASGGTNVNIEIPLDFFRDSGGSVVGNAAARRALLGIEADTSHSHIAFENHKRGYPLVTDANNGVNFTADTASVAQATLNMAAGLREDLSQGSEILKVRVKQFRITAAAPESRLLMNDFHPDGPGILDRAVDGLQISYLADGTWQDNPGRAENIRAIRVYLLVRGLYPRKGLVNTVDYSAQMGPSVASDTYGPYNDAFPRLVISKDVEVKNYVAR